MFIEIAQQVKGIIARIPFDTLIWVVWGSYLGIFVITLLITLFSRRFRNTEKKPFLALTNAYSGVNLAVFLLKCSISSSVIITAAFWVIGYILYGVLCLCSIKKKNKKETAPRPDIPVQSIYSPPVRPASNRVPAAQSNVKLEHAVSVTESLLSKNLAKSDRQELEKMKSTLAVLQIKGTLTPIESEILNENFNALLKLMAKYNA